MAHETVTASEQPLSLRSRLVMNRLARLLAVLALVLLVAACDGGPSNGELTVHNDTDRPVMWISGSSLDQALEQKRYIQLQAVIGPGERAETTMPRNSNGVSPGKPWCMAARDYWVITSNTDDVADFVGPIDPDTITVEEHLVHPCWEGPRDEYIIE